MNKLKFVVLLLLMFAIEWLPVVREYLITPFTEYLAAISAALLKLFDADVSSNGIVISSLSTGQAVAILAGCNGVEAMICLTAAILAYPSSWKQRVIGLLLGYCAIQVLNILRIISLFYLLQWNQHWFEIAHLYVWQGLIFLDVLIVFIVWMRWVNKGGSTAPPQLPMLNHG
jgi:exosortase H (IPTLxxWG-CTERM-specific)